MENKMEIQLKEFTPQPIEFENFEQLKKDIEEKTQRYKSIVYTEESVKEAKADKAKLVNLVNAADRYRINTKKRYMQPFEVFEAQVKEIVKLVNEPVQLIGDQIKTFEDAKKAEKESKIQAIFEEEAMSAEEEIKLKQIWDDKWLNVTVTLKKVQEAIHDKIAKFNADLKTLSILPEFSFEAAEYYKRTLDLNGAIEEGKRLAAIQEQKKAHEARQAEIAEKARLKAEEDARVKEAEKVAVPVQNEPETVCEEPVSMAVDFRCWLTPEQGAALRKFFNANEIKFERI